MVEHLDALVDLQPKAEQLKWGVAGRNLAKLKMLDSEVAAFASQASSITAGCCLEQTLKDWN